MPASTSAGSGWTPTPVPRVIEPHGDDNETLQPAESLDEWYIPHVDITDRVRIGDGGFGVVYRANWRNHCTVAIKIISNLAPGDMQEFENEASIMRSLRHDHIISFFGVCVDGAQPPGIVMQCMVNGSLYSVLADHVEFPDSDLHWVQRCCIALDSSKGVAYLHSKNIIHRDLKPLNILLGEGLRARVSDFGLSRTRAATLITENVPASQMGAAGTPAYIAPELYEGGAASKAVDVYALAIVLWEIVTRDRPYQNFNNQLVLMGAVVMQNARPAIPANCRPRVSTLMQNCWSAAPADRPTIENVVEELEQEHAEAVQLHI